MTESNISFESRQVRLNQQRQKIRDNMSRKHEQHIRSIQTNDNHSKRSPKFTLLKEDYSSTTSERNKFAYDGPQAFELMELETEEDAEIEVIYPSDPRVSQSSTEGPGAVIISNKLTSGSSEPFPSHAFEYSPLLFDKDEEECNDVERLDHLNQIRIKKSSETLSSQLQLSLESLAMIESNGNVRDDSVSGSLNAPEMAVSPFLNGPPWDKAESSSDVDSRKLETCDQFLNDFIDVPVEMEAFVLSPGPEKYVVRCQISRDRRGVDKGMFPIYYLHLEKKDSKPLFLLAARRRKMSKTSNYLISCDATNLKRDGFGFLAKLRSNFMGTQFSIFDDGENSESKRDQLNKTSRREMAAITYEPNVLGFRGPRKMTIIIQDPDERKALHEFNQHDNGDALIERWKKNKMENLLELRNKKPLWNEDSQSYVLNFHGRVTQASVKNFQIIQDNDEDRIVMQFGRTSGNSFSMDYTYPLSGVQAFGIALSSFDGKLACE